MLCDAVLASLATPCNFVVFCCIYFHAASLYSVAYIFDEMLYRVVRNLAFVWATPPLNTIKQHGTISNKSCMMFYEMLYLFGRGFTRNHRRPLSQNNFEHVVSPMRAENRKCRSGLIRGNRIKTLYVQQYAVSVTKSLK